MNFRAFPHSFSVFSTIFRSLSRMNRFAPFTSRFILFASLLVCVSVLALNASAQPPCQPGGPPTLSAATGAGFDQITLSLTNPTSSVQYYYVYGSEDGGPYGGPVSIGVPAGVTQTWTTSAWGSNLWLKTNSTYQFYAVETVCGVSSNVES